ncbi:MAG: polysaccharide biosynthesis tyrosine autokinase [Anaerolineae bacterium]|nr:polysaccharide biosynthesis tyrosine autokinase [Anaerolineae bacterium]
MKTASPFQVVLKLILKWWWLMLISVALGAGVGYFIRSKQPNIYFARASVWFGQDFNDSSAINTIDQTASLIQIYTGLVMRDKILQPVIDNLNLGLSVTDLQARIATNADTALPLLEIVVADTDAVKAADIANAIAQEMITQSPTERQTEEQAFKRGQLRDLATQIETLNSDYDRLISEGAGLTSAFEIAQNLQQQNTTLANVRELQQLYADMSAGMADSASSLQLFDPATAENAFVVAGSFMSVILSGVAGLAVSLITIILLAYFDDRMQWHENLEQVEGVRVLGPLGIIPRSKLPLYVESMSDSVEAEMLRQLRAKLVLAAGGVSPRVVTVTSYDSGDGKTITAANLALAAAQSGLRTILVDGDIRKGDTHEIFRLPNVMGLSDILAGRDNIDVLLSRALLESGYDNLTVLTSGRSTADPASLVSGTRLIGVLQSLKSRFDAVIMDSVPTIGGPDSAFMAELSDGVVIVVHGQRTTHKGFKRTLQTVRQGRNVNIFGVVFNRIPLQITSTYSQPYYRRTLAISPDKLNKEILAAGTLQGLPKLSRNVSIDKNGGRLFSTAAAAVQLGVTHDTLKNWIKAGHLKAERRGLKQWIRETDINELLEHLPRAQVGTAAHVAAPPPALPAQEPVRPANGSSTNKISSGKIPDLLRGQRDALLASARGESPSEPQDE